MVGEWGGGVGGVERGQAKPLLEIENGFDVLHIFQIFYHFNGRLSLTNGLLDVPDGEMPEESQPL